MEGKTFNKFKLKQPRLAVGYECTPISNAERICGSPRDVLDANRHDERFEHDFDLQEELGISELRYPACWDKVLIEPYRYDFEAIAPIMESMRRRGFVPTIDLCHHKVPKISIVSRALKQRNPRIRFFQPEPIDHDAVTENADEEILAHVKFLREHGRFGMDNLLRGKIDEAHPFFKRLVERGANAERVLWFQTNPAETYQKDLDFYVHCFKV